MQNRNVFLKKLQKSETIEREEMGTWEVFFFSFFIILSLCAREFEHILWANVNNFLSVYEVPLPHYYLFWA